MTIMTQVILPTATLIWKGKGEGKMKIGDTVKFSSEGLRNLGEYPSVSSNRRGKFCGYTRGGFIRVNWNGLSKKTIYIYAPEFINFV